MNDVKGCLERLPNIEEPSFNPKEPETADAASISPLLFAELSATSSAKPNLVKMPKAPGKLKSSNSLAEGMVRRVFAHYCQKFGHQPTRYSLEGSRLATGMRRADERLSANGGDAQAAEADLFEAVDNVANDEWSREHGATDWELIFRSQAQFEKKLNLSSASRQTGTAPKAKTVMEKMQELA